MHGTQSSLQTPCLADIFLRVTLTAHRDWGCLIDRSRRPSRLSYRLLHPDALPRAIGKQWAIALRYNSLLPQPSITLYLYKLQFFIDFDSPKKVQSEAKG